MNTNAERKEIAIIGGGFSGTALAINLARHEGPPTILLHEREQAGFGLAYSTTDRAHLLNVRAANMSALPDDPGHFVRWLEREGAGLGSCFVPRQSYGRYVAQLLEETCAVCGDRLETRRALVTGIERKVGGYRLQMASGEPAEASRVVLAMGNPPPAHPPQLSGLAGLDPRYIGDPWKADLASLVRSDSHVLLLGTGLTAVDVALQLRHAGFSGRLTALSRRGLLPRTHAQAPPPPPLAQAPEPQVRRLLRDVREAARHMDWRQAIDRLRPHTQLSWQRMPEAEKRRFLRHVRPWWDVHRHRTAPAVAGQIEALVESGQLVIRRGRLVRVGAEGTDLSVDVLSPCGATEQLRVDRIINCTGPSADLGTAEAALLVSLREQGLARTDRLGLGLETDHVGRVIDQAGRPAPDLYAVGPLTRGTFWEITAVPDIRRQVWFLARQLAGAHWVGGEGL